MRLRFIALAAAIAFLLTPRASFARPEKGFHTGPYLAFEIGGMQADFDYDKASNLQIGRDFEPTYGFLFGWNIFDYFSTELQGRYATSMSNGRREHIAVANLFCKGTLVADALTDFKNLRILPFAKAGLAFRFAALPGDPGSTDNNVLSVGVGPSVGAGIAFLLYKYFYFGIDIQGDFFFTNSIHETVNNVPGVLVYNGGFYPSFNAMAMIGVHY